MSKVSRFQLPYDNDQLVCIGTVTTISSFNDYLLDTLICELLEVPTDRGRIALTKIQNTPRKCDIVTALMESTSKNDLAIRMWKSLSRRIGRAAEQRANLTHGIWNRDSKGDWHVVRYKAKDKGSGTQFQMGTKEILALSRKLFKIATDLSDWIVRYRKQTDLARALLQSSPDKSA